MLSQCWSHRHVRRAHALQKCALRPSLVHRALYLRPTGTGDTSHLDGESASLTTPFLLLPGQHMVGRTEDSNVCIAIPTVSSRHAMLIVDDQGGATVTDLQSTNGTIVDGRELEPLKPCELHTGSDLIFGDSSLARYEVELRPEATPLVLDEAAGFAASATTMAAVGAAVGAAVEGEEDASALAQAMVEAELSAPSEEEPEDGDWQESWPSEPSEVHYAIAPDYTTASNASGDPITDLFEPGETDHSSDKAAADEDTEPLSRSDSSVQDDSAVEVAVAVEAAVEEAESGAADAPEEVAEGSDHHDSSADDGGAVADSDSAGDAGDDQ